MSQELKPLEWHDVKGQGLNSIAYTPWENYTVYNRYYNGFHYFSINLRGGSVEFHTRQEAKDAAESDFKERMGKFLVPALPVTDGVWEARSPYVKEAIRMIGLQKTSDELAEDPNNDPEHADYSFAYDSVLKLARLLAAEISKGASSIWPRPLYPRARGRGWRARRGMGQPSSPTTATSTPIRRV